MIHDNKLDLKNIMNCDQSTMVRHLYSMDKVQNWLNWYHVLSENYENQRIWKIIDRNQKSNVIITSSVYCIKLRHLKTGIKEILPGRHEVILQSVHKRLITLEKMRFKSSHIQTTGILQVSNKKTPIILRSNLK